MMIKNSLRNAFYFSLPNNGSQEGINSTTRRMEEAKVCEKIADEFAIGFKDWCDNEGRFTIGVNTTNELLEIYKKEKGL